MSPFFKKKYSMKRYTSSSDISINVRKEGKNVHISFDSITGGGSQFYTDDESLQKAIESHPRYGELFKKAPAEPVVVAHVAEEQHEEEPGSVKVGSLADAKDYLVRNYDIPRSNLKTKQRILEAAQQVGVTFEGIE